MSTKQNTSTTKTDVVDTEDVKVPEVDTIENGVNTRPLSPYGAAKLVNAALADAGLTKRIPPQMMYNYTTARVNAGKTPLIGFDKTTGVDRESLNEWTTKYVAKHTPKVETETETDES